METQHGQGFELLQPCESSFFQTLPALTDQACSGYAAAPQACRCRVEARPLSALRPRSSSIADELARCDRSDKLQEWRLEREEMFCKSIQEQLGPQVESIRSRVDLLTTSVKESRAEKRLGARAPPSGGMSETELGATQFHLRRIGQEAA